MSAVNSENAAKSTKARVLRPPVDKEPKALRQKSRPRPSYDSFGLKSANPPSSASR